MVSRAREACNTADNRGEHPCLDDCRNESKLQPNWSESRPVLPEDALEAWGTRKSKKISALLARDEGEPAMLCLHDRFRTRSRTGFVSNSLELKAK